MDNKNFVSIIIPVIRPQNIAKLIKLIKKNAGVPKNEYEILTEEDTARIGAPKMVKKLTDKAKYDLVMFLGDDCEPLPNFLSVAIETMQEFQGKWGLVGLYDVERPGDHAPAHWLAHKKLLKFTGEFFHTGYTHQYCDNELYMWASYLNRYKLNELAQVNHKHVGFKDKNKTFKENIAASNDDDMKRVYSNYSHDFDQSLFRRRQEVIIRSTHKCIPLGIKAGSSMLAGSLAIMGMDTVDKDWKAKDHWENNTMKEINLSILDMFGCSPEHPDLPKGFENDPRLDPLYDKAHTIKKFIIKHSLTMVTLPFWRKAFTILPVFINKDINVIILSLLKEHNIKVAKGRQIWNDYTKRMRLETIRGMNMAEFNYDDYISDPIPYIKRVYSSFGLKWMYDKSKEDTLKEFVNPKLK